MYSRNKTTLYFETFSITELGLWCVWQHDLPKRMEISINKSRFNNWGLTYRDNV